LKYGSKKNGRNTIKSSKANMRHTPVLLKEVIDNLNIKPNGLYIDATVGEGGHGQEILKKQGRLLGIDRDERQIEGLKQKEIFKNAFLFNDNFANIEDIAKKNKYYPVDGIIFDLGLSMRQIQKSKKGFSYKNEDEYLDMRLSNNIIKTASSIINSLKASELYEIFTKYSEEINSRAIAKGIVNARSLKKIEKVGDLLRIIDKTIKRKDKQVYARIFQALRIAVNNEFENLKKALKGARNIINSNGRIIVISFHSLEDRIVKRFAKENGLKLLTKKPIVGKKNIKHERSAKLRIIFKNNI